MIIPWATVTACHFDTVWPRARLFQRPVKRSVEKSLSEEASLRQRDGVSRSTFCVILGAHHLVRDHSRWDL